MYDVRPIELSEEGIAECVKLLNIVFPLAKHLTYEYLDWEYNRNPAGTAVGYNAYSDGEVVAHYVTQPIVAKLFGKYTRGVLSLNTATHPEHRGKKLFVTLAEKTYVAASEKGYEFVIGVGNANSTPGLVKKLGFQLVCPLVAKVGIGGQVVREIMVGTIEYERIWTKELLHWRTANPSSQYAIGRKQDRFVIEAPTKKFGIYAILGEFDMEMYDRYHVVSQKTRYNPLKLWIGLDSSINWSRSMFYDIPKRLRPSPLNLVFKDLTGSSRKLSADKVKFQVIDFDAY